GGVRQRGPAGGTKVCCAVSTVHGLAERGGKTSPLNFVRTTKNVESLCRFSPMRNANKHQPHVWPLGFGSNRTTDATTVPRGTRQHTNNYRYSTSGYGRKLSREAKTLFNNEIYFSLRPYYQTCVLLMGGASHSCYLKKSLVFSQHKRLLNPSRCRMVCSSSSRSASLT
ncbi:unnamed protein product, partial [Ectocarpus sp. 12 AP-2014]